MRTAAILAAAAGVATAQNVTTGALGNATVTTNNPPGVVLQATLPSTAFDTAAYPSGGNAVGSISAVASPNGVGVMFTVQFSNLPKEGGPFLYHIHANPVPANGDCTATLGHQDPFVRGETPACDASLPQTCQTGDLSGKWGKVESDPFVAHYTDNFVSTLAGSQTYFGNLSFVLHFANKTRITCANFAVVSQPSSTSPSSNCSTTTSGTSGATGTVVTSPSPTFVTVSKAAGGLASSPVLAIGALVLGAMAFAF